MCPVDGLRSLSMKKKRTGTNDKRSELQRLMKDARSRKLDVVLCYKLDRFFRSLKNMVVTLEEFSELRVNFVCLKDQIDMTTSTGRLMTHIIAAFAEFESAIIKERVTAGVHAAMKKKGGRPWGPPRKFDKDNVHALKKKGNSIDEIAEKLKISRSSVFKTLAG